MCGIAGVFHFSADREADGSVLSKMTDTLTHRGPDGEGHFIRGNVGLGHRRLTIIDLSTGDQPLISEDGSIAIVFNGEIYNYLELRDELQKFGFKFRTNSDTEVIMHAYRHWGVECQNRFNGMWAFALWDDRNKQLLISRDRLGEKPIYYTVFDNTLVFASEIKALMAYGIPMDPNWQLTELYLSLGYIPAPFSFYRNVSKLSQGHYLVVTDVIREVSYWDIPPLNEREMIEDVGFVHNEFERLFYDSIRIRMRCDVPFGAFLSGGLDSASVVAAMSEMSKHPVETFTIGFDDKEFDERKIAADVASTFSTNHSEFVVQPDSFDESLSRILYHYDEPFGDSSAIPTGYVSKIASHRVKMVLTGDGGDEVLSGYNSYQIEKFSEQYRKLPSVLQQVGPRLVSPVKGLVSAGSIRYRLNRIERILDYSAKSFERRLIIKSAWYETDLIGQMTSGFGPQVKIADFIGDFFRKYNAEDPFYKLMMFHFKVALPDGFLVKVDRMSMANSLETRIPFLDHRLVELMMRVSKNVKMRGYERKSVLRRTVGRRLPKSVLRGSKKGFTTPMREWFKDTSFRDKLRDLWQQDFGLDRKIIRDVVEDHMSGKTDSGHFIWMLMVLKGWTAKNG